MGPPGHVLYNPLYQSWPTHVDMYIRRIQCIMRQKLCFNNIQILDKLSQYSPLDLPVSWPGCDPSTWMLSSGSLKILAWSSSSPKILGNQSWPRLQNPGCVYFNRSWPHAMLARLPDFTTWINVIKRAWFHSILVGMGWTWLNLDQATIVG